MKNSLASSKKFIGTTASLSPCIKKISGLDLTDSLKNYAQTGSEYTRILNQIITQTSSKRLGIVEDIIAAIEFIEKSNFYNGEILKLNGGR